ncbi:MAG: hypothetical protein ACRD0H_16965 [Actinomycetes bacterium]
MSEQPGLFDLPDPPVARPVRSPGRGRARETFTRTVVADMTVQDTAVLRAEALRMLDGGIILDDVLNAAGEELPDSRDEVATSSAAALEWCLEPTTGLVALLETGGAILRAIELGVQETADAGLRASWTVTVQLHDVPAVRELALQSCPAADAEARTAIEESFAAAWHWAAEPYAPLRVIPGIAWLPVEVTVKQVFARSR